MNSENEEKNQSGLKKLGENLKYYYVVFVLQYSQN